MDYEMVDLINPDTVIVNGVEFKATDKTGDETWGHRFNNFWTHIMKGYAFPLKLWVVTFDGEFSFSIELKENENFDIHKLQFIYSEEFEPFEDYAFAARINYNGKLIEEEQEGGGYSYPVMGSGAANRLVFNKFDFLTSPKLPAYVKLF